VQPDEAADLAGGRTLNPMIHHHVQGPHRVAVLHVTGDLGDATVGELAALVAQYFQAASPSALVLDLTEARSISRGVAETFAAQARLAGEADIGFYFVVAPGRVAETLTAAGGGDILDINATVADALRAM
jgi:anti-anti-sigma factor